MKVEDFIHRISSWLDERRANKDLLRLLQTYPFYSAIIAFRRKPFTSKEEFIDVMRVFVQHKKLTEERLEQVARYSQEEIFRAIRAINSYDADLLARRSAITRQKKDRAGTTRTH